MSPTKVLCAFFCLILAMACGNDSGEKPHRDDDSEKPHRAVGKWQSSDREIVLNLFPGGTGSLKSRSCLWKKIDQSSVKTDCERPLVDNAVRVFTVRETEDGKMIGRLESYTETFLKIGSDSGSSISEFEAVAEVLPPVWIENNEADHALGGQVLIAVSNASDYGATLRITRPDASVIEFEGMSVGTRKIVTLKGDRYFLDLLASNKYDGAKVSLIAVE